MAAECSLKALKKPGLRKCFFDPAENPAINRLKYMSQRVFMNMPDISLWEGWRMLALRAFGIMLALSLITQCVSASFSIESLIALPLLMSLFFGIVYAKQLSGTICDFLEKWETFGKQ